jgi:cytochrome c oxidase subunit 4
MEDQSTKNKHYSIGYGTYVLVWAGLISFTAITVALTGFKLAAFAVVVALLIASVKSLMVANYFMHVKFDSKIFKVFILLCIVIFLTMIILTFFDLIYREPLI